MSGSKWDDLIFILILLAAVGSCLFIVVMGFGYWFGYNLAILINGLLIGLLPM